MSNLTEILPADIGGDERAEIFRRVLAGGDELNELPEWYRAFLAARFIADCLRMSVPEVLAMPEDERVRAYALAILESDLERARMNQHSLHTPAAR